MKSARLFLLTIAAMIAFASNSLLCRAALKQTHIDAATFTFVRIFSGAVALWLMIKMRRISLSKSGSWLFALALFTYAAAGFCIRHHAPQPTSSSSWPVVSLDICLLRAETETLAERTGSSMSERLKQ